MKHWKKENYEKKKKKIHGCVCKIERTDSVERLFFEWRRCYLS